MATKKKRPRYTRQNFLLSLVGQLNEAVTATDIQKLVFAYLQSTSEKIYEFIPYKYGPYSFQLAEDIDTLCKEGFIIKDRYNKISVTESQTLSFMDIFPERGDALIRRVYREYPYYATNSEILGRLFSENEKKRYIHLKESLHKSEQLLFTIGYEGKSLEGFVNALIQADVRLLCDVRKNPISRKFGFSKTKLKHVLKAVGIKYMHIPEVGVPSDKRTFLNTSEDYDALFDDYKRNISQIAWHLDYILKLLKKSNRIALMCFEKNPEFCHRHIIRDYLVEHYHVNCEEL